LSPPRLGIVIPTLNEAARLPLLLGDLAELPVPHRVVVADGGSTDDTAARAREEGARVVSSPRGRGRQLNAGARAAGTPWLLFLHADVRLSRAAGEALASWLEKDGEERAAYFRFGLEGPDRFWRFLEWGQRLRERLTGLAYGDQGLVVSRSLFERVGGYPEIPLMEDVEIIRRLRRIGSVERLDAVLRTSPRRYEREGRWRAWLRNSVLITLYFGGADPERLARWYRPGSSAGGSPKPRAGNGMGTASRIGTSSGGRGATGAGTASRSRDGTGRSTPGGGEAKGGMGEGGSVENRILLVFVKAPIPGKVKTRLATHVGEAEAAAFYRRLGKGVVDQVRDRGYRSVIFYAPADREDEVRSWLGDEGLEYRPQARGDLGRRMEEALAWALTQAGKACVIGTDAPGVDREVVQGAFRALDDADAVVGPARDGGYYLLGLTRPVPALFREIPWSTDRVLDRTLDRARRQGLRVRLLDERLDVDTADDLEPEVLASMRNSG